jgi:hypothetical protein
MGSSSGTAQSTSTQNLTPEQQQLVGLAMPGYQQFAGSTFTPPTGNQAVAGFTAPQQQGQADILGATPQMGQTVGTAAGTNRYLSSGAFLDPGSNPYVQNAVKAATDPIFQNLAQTTIPGLQGTAASGSGQNYGSSREGTAEGLATQGAQRAAGTAGANIMETALGQGLTATGQAVAQAPTTAASLGQPGAVESAVGDVQQQQQQNVLNANNQAAMLRYILPLLQAQELTQGAAGLPGGSVSSTGQTTQQAAPWQIAAGLMAGAGSLMGGGSGGLIKSLNLGAPFMGGGTPSGFGAVPA